MRRRMRLIGTTSSSSPLRRCVAGCSRLAGRRRRLGRLVFGTFDFAFLLVDVAQDIVGSQLGRLAAMSAACRPCSRSARRAAGVTAISSRLLFRRAFDDLLVRLSVGSALPGLAASARLCFFGAFWLGLRWSCQRRPVFDVADDVADGDHVAFFFQDLAEDAGGRRGEFHRSFVGFQLDDVFVERDGVAFVLEPAADLDFADGFAHFGNFQFDTHARVLLKRSGD